MELVLQPKTDLDLFDATSLLTLTGGDNNGKWKALSPTDQVTIENADPNYVERNRERIEELCIVISEAE